MFTTPNRALKNPGPVYMLSENLMADISTPLDLKGTNANPRAGIREGTNDKINSRDEKLCKLRTLSVENFIHVTKAQK